MLTWHAKKIYYTEMNDIRDCAVQFSDIILEGTGYQSGVIGNCKRHKGLCMLTTVMTI